MGGVTHPPSIVIAVVVTVKSTIARSFIIYSVKFYERAYTADEPKKLATKSLTLVHRIRPFRGFVGGDIGKGIDLARPKPG